jgi:hypothetical protein
MLGLFITRQIFDPTHNNPNWKNRSVVLSSFVNTSQDRIRTPTPKLNLSGFHFTEIEAYVAILANAISFIIAFSKKVKKIWLKVVGARSVNLPIEKFS